MPATDPPHLNVISATGLSPFGISPLQQYTWLRALLHLYFHNMSKSTYTLAGLIADNVLIDTVNIPQREISSSSIPNQQ